MTTRDEAQIGSLIRVASRLVSLMDQETERLRGMRPRDIVALQSEKTALAAAYEDKVRELGANPDALKRVSEALQQEFAEVAARFQAALADNERALHAARRTQERVMQAIVSVVEKDRARRQGYGAAGNGGQARKTDPLSLALDRHL
jgi:uncharacterized protein YPO0396